MKMDTDIQLWLSHINKKRKHGDNEDQLLKELTLNSIESLIELINLNSITKKDLHDFLDGMEEMYIATLMYFENENKINKNKDFMLLLRACTNVSVELIQDIRNAYMQGGNKKMFNIITYLNNKKKEYNIPIKERKLNKIQIKLDKINTIFEKQDDDDDDDDDYEPSSENDDDDDDYSDNKIKQFMNSIKKISNSSNSSKDELIEYFNHMNSNNKKETINQLSLLTNGYDNMPYLFRILNAPLDNITKKNIINKILSSNGFGSGKLKKWVDDVMKIPFGQYKGIDLTSISDKPIKVKNFLDNLLKLMNDAVYGHDNAKKQIVQIMAQMIRNPQSTGSVIGIWGVPGNGKTSLIKEGISKAMDRPFVFISLGGIVDSSFLDGHSFTYEGSIYGRIAQALITSKCMNPIIYFDELDKVSKCPKGDEIINMLIHLVDPVQNKLFRDKYFYDVDLDLSKVTFIFSFNEPENINHILRDRITMINTKYLSTEMKLHIAKNYLIPDICKDVGIKNTDIIIPDDVIINIILNYTNEGGVRKLKEKIYKIIRELNHCNLTNNKILGKSIKFPITFTNLMFNDMFKDNPKYIHLTVHKNDGVGMVNGLWANSLGQGGVLPIESVLIPAKELMSVKTTGSLGEVIKESIDVALSVAWNKLDEETKTFWMNKWKTTPECFHIHCPDGSTGKEGPSAGAAMTLAFYSRLTNKKVNHLVAMTGEINLREEVTAIGGLDEKLNAAKRAGAVLALIPKENNIDLNNVIKHNPSLIDDNFKVITVENINEVIKYALC